jgi:selenium metabolism protein YedF
MTENVAKDLVVLVSSEQMGSGDASLGETLMASFLSTLGHFEGQLSHLLFVNGGAKLVVEGSPVLEQVRALETRGVAVQTCGTCLRHFGVEAKLAVGEVSGMFAIIETLSAAGRTIQL